MLRNLIATWWQPHDKHRRLLTCRSNPYLHNKMDSSDTGTYFCTVAMVDFSLGFETWKMLFSPKLMTGTRGDPVFTAIRTKPWAAILFSVDLDCLHGTMCHCPSSRVFTTWRVLISTA